MGKGLKKDILFIGIGFSSFDDIIKKQLSEWYNVTYFDSCEYDHKISKWIFLLQKLHVDFYREAKNASLIEKHLDEVKDIEFDKIFVLKGDHLTITHLEKIKSYFPKATLHYYTWDSWKNLTNTNVIIGYFPIIHSFDSEDCKQYGFKLRPLFYTDDDRSEIKDIDISFIGRGQGNNNRFLWLKKVKQLCIEHKLQYLFKLVPGKYCAFRWKYIDRISDNNDNDILSKDGLPYSEYRKLLKRSKCIVDFPHPLQSGLTMRTIEALAVGTKVITTNQHIAEYSDIPSECYMVLSEQTTEEELVPFISNSSSIPLLTKKYSLSDCLKEILNVEI